MNVDAAPQSWSAAIVDIAAISAMLIMALNHVTEPAAWTLLGAVVSGRFGVSLGKSIERTAARSGEGGGPGGGSGRSGSMRAVQDFPMPQQRPPSSGGGGGGGSSGPVATRVSFAKQYAMVLALAVSIASATVIARIGLQMVANR